MAIESFGGRDNEERMSERAGREIRVRVNLLSPLAISSSV